MPALKYDYVGMRTRFISAEPKLSVAAVAAEFGIPHERHSTIHRRAMKEGWEDLRDKRLTKTDDKVIEQLSDREAKRRLRRMQVEDNALEAIDEAITKMRGDMKRLKKEKDPETQEYVMVPAVTYRPEQVVQLMDRIKGLFDGTVVPADDKPNLNLGVNLNFDGHDPEQRRAVAQLLEHTRGSGGPSVRSAGSSPLPTAPGPSSDQ